MNLGEVRSSVFLKCTHLLKTHSTSKLFHSFSDAENDADQTANSRGLSLSGPNLKGRKHETHSQAKTQRCGTSQTTPGIASQAQGEERLIAGITSGSIIASGNNEAFSTRVRQRLGPVCCCFSTVVVFKVGVCESNPKRERGRLATLAHASGYLACIEDSSFFGLRSKSGKLGCRSRSSPEHGFRRLSQVSRVLANGGYVTRN
jgi:hypothetical protein